MSTPRGQDALTLLADNLLVMAQPALRQRSDGVPAGKPGRASSDAGRGHRSGSIASHVQRMKLSSHSTAGQKPPGETKPPLASITEQQRWLQQLPASVRDQAAQYLKQHATLLGARSGPARPEQTAEALQAAATQTLAKQLEQQLAVQATQAGPGQKGHLVTATGPASVPAQPAPQLARQPPARSLVPGSAPGQLAQAPPQPQKLPLHAVAAEAKPKPAPKRVAAVPRVPAAAPAAPPAAVPAAPAPAATQAPAPARAQNAVPALKLTAATLRQVPVQRRPWRYDPVPSELASHAEWWRPDSPASCASYPRTAVTDEESATASEVQRFERKMQDLEKSLLDERRRRQEFEAQLKELEGLAAIRRLEAPLVLPRVQPRA